VSKPLWKPSPERLAAAKAAILAAHPKDRAWSVPEAMGACGLPFHLARLAIQSLRRDRKIPVSRKGRSPLTPSETKRQRDSWLRKQILAMHPKGRHWDCLDAAAATGAEANRCAEVMKALRLQGLIPRPPTGPHAADLMARVTDARDPDGRERRRIENRIEAARAARLAAMAEAEARSRPRLHHPEPRANGGPR
jgi:hypothetical protein